MNQSDLLTKHLTIQDLSERLGVKVQTIRHWRMRGEGPRSFSPGGRLVRYRLEDVEAWEREQLEASA